jgi:hypothetical protein
MSSVPGPEELYTESDVEQKPIMPLLTNPRPSGLAERSNFLLDSLFPKDYIPVIRFYLFWINPVS